MTTTTTNTPDNRTTVGGFPFRWKTREFCASHKAVENVRAFLDSNFEAVQDVTMGVGEYAQQVRVAWLQGGAVVAFLSRGYVLVVLDDWFRESDAKYPKLTGRYVLVVEATPAPVVSQEAKQENERQLAKLVKASSMPVEATPAPVEVAPAPVEATPTPAVSCYNAEGEWVDAQGRTQHPLQLAREQAAERLVLAREAMLAANSARNAGGTWRDYERACAVFEHAALNYAEALEREDEWLRESRDTPDASNNNDPVTATVSVEEQGAARALLVNTRTAPLTPTQAEAELEARSADLASDMRAAEESRWRAGEGDALTLANLRSYERVTQNRAGLVTARAAALRAANLHVHPMFASFRPRAYIESGVGGLPTTVVEIHPYVKAEWDDRTFFLMIRQWGAIHGWTGLVKYTNPTPSTRDLDAWNRQVRGYLTAAVEFARMFDRLVMFLAGELGGELTPALDAWGQGITLTPTGQVLHNCGDPNTPVHLRDIVKRARELVDARRRDAAAEGLVTTTRNLIACAAAGMGGERGAAQWVLSDAGRTFIERAVVAQVPERTDTEELFKRVRFVLSCEARRTLETTTPPPAKKSD